MPQALVLTAIVIALGTTAFLLAMAHRSWQLNANDDVQDDVEDASIRRLAAADEASDSHDLATGARGRRRPDRGGRMSFLVPLPVILPLFGAGPH